MLGRPDGEGLSPSGYCRPFTQIVWYGGDVIPKGGFGDGPVRLPEGL